jgi:hypothetical protein
MRITMTILIFASTILWCCSNHTDKKNDAGLTLTANWGGFNWRAPVVRSASETIRTIYDSATVIHVAVTISNPTSDTLQFPSMSCSYEDFFLVSDTINFMVQGKFDCFMNFPCRIVLPPRSKTDRYLMLRQLTNFRTLPKEPIRIGMRLENKIIWSNELNINRMVKDIYY